MAKAKKLHGGRARKKAPTKPTSRVSERDVATLTRLRNRLGPTALIKLIQSDLQTLTKAGSISRGAPRMEPTRQCLLAVLYHSRLCKGHITIPAFAKRLERVVEIKYSRTTPPTYRSLISLGHLEK